MKTTATIILLLIGMTFSLNLTPKQISSLKGSISLKTRKSLSGYFKDALKKIKKETPSKALDTLIEEFDANSQFLHTKENLSNLNEDKFIIYYEKLYNLWNYLQKKAKKNHDYQGFCTNMADKLFEYLASQSEVKQEKKEVIGSEKKTIKTDKAKLTQAVVLSEDQIISQNIATPQLEKLNKAQLRKDLISEKNLELQQKNGEDSKKDDSADSREKANKPVLRLKTKPSLVIKKNEQPINQGLSQNDSLEEVQAVKPSVENEKITGTDNETTTPAKKQRKRRIHNVFVFEILECKNCNEDENIQKYIDSQK